VQDLFGDEDVVVVPANANATTKRIDIDQQNNGSSKSKKVKTKAKSTIELIVTLASIVIKVHGRYDVYPKNVKDEHCEPLIQLHTTTTETISLQGVRVRDIVTDPLLDKTDGLFPIITPDHGKIIELELEQNDETESASLDDDDFDASTWTSSSAVVLQERITDGTGRRMLSIRPAKYKKVLVTRIHS
jgi:hypothetical protein